MELLNVASEGRGESGYRSIEWLVVVPLVVVVLMVSGRGTGSVASWGSGLG